jgi:hypothetical protein
MGDNAFPHLDGFTRNATIETFWTHARCLIEFFTQTENGNFHASSARGATRCRAALRRGQGSTGIGGRWRASDAVKGWGRRREARRAYSGRSSGDPHGGRKSAYALPKPRSHFCRPPVNQAFYSAPKTCSVAAERAFLAVRAHRGEQKRVALDTCRPFRHLGMGLEQPGLPHLRLALASIPTSAMVARFAARSL